jgi:hypothetical protein
VSIFCTPTYGTSVQPRLYSKEPRGWSGRAIAVVRTEASVTASLFAQAIPSDKARSLDRDGVPCDLEHSIERISGVGVNRC